MESELLRDIVRLLTSIDTKLTPKASPKMQVKTAPLSDDAWLAQLSADPTYAGIDVRREYGKSKSWADTNKKQVTRRFFINWLNRVERPVVVARPSMQAPAGAPPVYSRKTESLPEGVGPDPESAAKLSRILGGEFMKSMGGGR